MFSRTTSSIMWPLSVLWRLITLIIEPTSRSIAVLVGLVLVILGLLVSLTVIGTVVGIPFILLGILLMARGLF